MSHAGYSLLDVSEAFGRALEISSSLYPSFICAPQHMRSTSQYRR